MRKNALLMALYEALGLLVPLIITPYISRTIGADGVGVYSYTYSIAAYFVIAFQLGIKLYGRREIAKVNDDREKYIKTFWQIFYTEGLMFIIVLPIYILFICFGGFEESIRIALIIQIGELLAGFFDISWFYFGMERFGVIVVRNVVIRVLEIVLTFCLVRDASGVYMYVLVMAISTCLGSASMWINIRKTIAFLKPTVAGIKKQFLPLLQLFIPVLSTQIFSIVDKTIIGAFIDVTHVGFYENAYKIARVPVVIITALGNVMLPRITKLIADKREKEAHRYIDKSMFLIMFTCCAISFGMCAVAGRFIPLYLGSGFSESTVLFQILAFLLIFIGWGNVIRTQYMLPRGYDKLYTRAVVYGSVMNIILSIILIFPFGTIGVAIATVCCEIVNCVYSTFKVRKEIHVNNMLKGSSMYFVSGLLMLVGVLLINQALKGLSDLPALIIEILAGAFIYFVFVFLFEMISGRKTVISEVCSLWKTYTAKISKKIFRR